MSRDDLVLAIWVAIVACVAGVIFAAREPTVEQTLLLSDATVLVRRQPAADCRLQRVTLEEGGSVLLTGGPWGQTYEVRKIWCEGRQ